MSGNGEFGSHSRPRAAINAWLEEISFRTGVIVGGVVLVVIAAVGEAVAVFGHGGQAASALGSRGTGKPATVAPSTVQSAAASGSSRESSGLAGPAGWRHGFPPGRGGRGWVWGPYRGGPHFGGPWR